MIEHNNTFEILLLIARPAAGKSEIIDYLKKTDLTERVARFHINEFDVIDDFSMIWTWFEEDQLLVEMGLPRLHTTPENYFSENYFWNLLIRKICLEYNNLLRDDPNYHEHKTAILEFSRGKQSGGYTAAFKHLSKQVIDHLAVMVVNVSWEESLRKNRARFNPEKPGSILEHGLSDEKMETLYKEDDLEALCANDPAYLNIQGKNVPYAVFENEDDVTTARGKALGDRLEQTLDLLWKRWNSR
ncbi:MAG: hypothetical protein J7L73_07375 [Anaerolineales bacterium]|nr:hypothetical protein [Anaerolineales bacterium]